jgi:hypothetical protein
LNRIKNAEQNEHMLIGTHMMKAHMCYQLEKNYFSWLYENINNVMISMKTKKRNRTKAAASILRTDYEVAMDWKPGHDLKNTFFVDFLFQQPIEIVHQQDLGTFQVYVETDDEYKNARKEQIKFHINLAKSANASQHKLAYVHKLLQEEKPTTRQNMNRLKTLGLTECKTKIKRLLSNKRKNDAINEEKCSSSDDAEQEQESSQSSVEFKIAGKINEDGMTYHHSKVQEFLVYEENGCLWRWENCYRKLCQQFSPYNTLEEKKKQGKPQEFDCREIAKKNMVPV